MKKEEIITTLKTHYPREVRKQLIKSIQESEKIKNQEAIEQQYKVINQIFTYILQESNWKMGKDSENWDNSPLEIMNKIFPKLNQTVWYQNQNIATKSNLDIKIGIENK